VRRASAEVRCPRRTCSSLGAAAALCAVLRCRRRPRPPRGRRRRCRRGSRGRGSQGTPACGRTQPGESGAWMDRMRGAGIACICPRVQRAEPDVCTRPHARPFMYYIIYLIIMLFTPGRRRDDLWEPWQRKSSSRQTPLWKRATACTPSGR